MADSAQSQVKKIKKSVYELSFAGCPLEDKDEFAIRNGISEFTTSFKTTDTTKAVVTPGGYGGKGMFYSVEDDGSFYSSPNFDPDMLTFNFDILGLRKGAFYQLTVKAKDAGKTSLPVEITKDRSLTVSNDVNDLVIKRDLTGVDEPAACHGIFRAYGTEAVLYFSIGKISISGIAIEEIEVDVGDSSKDEDEPASTIGIATLRVAAYGIFEIRPAQQLGSSKLRWSALPKLGGMGILCFYDERLQEFSIERDAANDILGDALSEPKFEIQIDLNKAVGYNRFSGYSITAVSSDVSENTLKAGSVRFALVDWQGRKVDPSALDGRMMVIVRKVM